MDTGLSTAEAVTAIRKGLDYLDANQLDSGEFVTYTGPVRDLRDAVPYPRSVYVTSFVIHSLSFLPPNPQQKRIQTRAADFLEAEEEAGCWNYEGRGVWRLPPDLDCTCCAVAALRILDRRSIPACYPVLWHAVRPNEAAPGGPYYTYIGVDQFPDDPACAPFAGDVDPLVNANVLFCGGLLGIELPGAAAYLSRIVVSEDYRGQSHYVISPHFVLYAISRAYADGRVGALRDVVPPAMRFLTSRLLDVDDEVSALNVACRALSLLNLGAGQGVVAPLLSALLTRQEADGSWPSWAAWAGFPPNYDGSPALTTALALESIGKWLIKTGSIRAIAEPD